MKSLVQTILLKQIHQKFVKLLLRLNENISIKIEIKRAKPQTPFPLYYVNLACAPTVQESHISYRIFVLHQPEKPE